MWVLFFVTSNREMIVNKGYVVPPYSRNENDEERKIGVELEFADLDVDECAEIVADVFSGSLNKQSAFAVDIENTFAGSFKVELDWQLGKKIAEQRTGDRIENSENDPDNVTVWMKKLAGQVVPVEIVCPPLRIADLDRLDTLVDALRDAGAKGTDESYIYAFGMHLNPEIPDSSAFTIARYLQAFCFAQNWLGRRHRIDPVRKITPYIRAYPEKYLDLVFGYSEDITGEQLVDDYMAHNATRNRALDMLPLWQYLYADHLEGFDLDDNLTQARPTFHYRLPNCEIDKKGWYPSESWNLWCVVEYLAAHEDVLNDLISRWQEDGSIFFKDRKQWDGELEKIHNDLK